jgi:glycerol kinase
MQKISKSFILAIDQGTTSSRVLVIDHNLKVVDYAQREFQQITPKVGWVEHDPEAIWSSVTECLQEMRAKHNLSKANVEAIGITNQRETTVAFSRKTGKPYHNAIVWLD